MDGLVLNLNKNPIGLTISLRNGRKCVIASTSSRVSRRIQSLRDGTLSVNGSRLFNVLPIKLRKIRRVSISVFKNELDQFLNTVPDEPQCCGYTASRETVSNSCLHLAEVI